MEITTGQLAAGALVRDAVALPLGATFLSRSSLRLAFPVLAQKHHIAPRTANGPGPRTRFGTGYSLRAEMIPHSVHERGRT